MSVSQSKWMNHSYFTLVIYPGLRTDLQHITISYIGRFIFSQIAKDDNLEVRDVSDSSPLHFTAAEGLKV